VNDEKPGLYTPQLAAGRPAGSKYNGGAAVMSSFFSIATFRTLLAGAGFRAHRIIRVGRIPPLAKSKITVARK
jgi:hypothetical protein